MQLQSLLRAEGIAPEDVAVMFHVSNRPGLNRILPWIADERPDLFDAFQNQHGPQAEAVLRRRRFLLSFVTSHGADYVFAGLFENLGHKHRTAEEFDADPLRIELRALCGEESFAERLARKGEAGRLEFRLQPVAALGELVGRLRVAKPSGRAYARLAENLDCPVVEITKQRQLAPPPPDWRDFIVSADEVRALPRDWAARLREWRGVYLIIDQSDRMKYVGSAYGADNILARWQAHVAGDKGVTKELAQRDPASFRFAILERTSPDLDKDLVIALEQSWKRRLDTLEHGLNRN